MIDELDRLYGVTQGYDYWHLPVQLKLSQTGAFIPSLRQRQQIADECFRHGSGAG